MSAAEVGESLVREAVLNQPVPTIPIAAVAEVADERVAVEQPIDILATGVQLKKRHWPENAVVKLCKKCQGGQEVYTIAV